MQTRPGRPAAGGTIQVRPGTPRQRRRVQEFAPPTARYREVAGRHVVERRQTNPFNGRELVEWFELSMRPEPDLVPLLVGRELVSVAGGRWRVQGDGPIVEVRTRRRAIINPTGTV